MKVLVTGGAGYIGSAVAAACLDANILPVLLDDLSATAASAVFDQPVPFYRAAIDDATVVGQVFADHPDIAAVVHCAAWTSVPDSVADPLAYYRNNVSATLTFLQLLHRHGCTRVVFSSSAAVYRPDPLVDETTPLEPGSPYGHSKAMVEQVLADAAAAGQMRAVCLRYFNVIGSGRGRSDVVSRMVAAWRGGEPFTITGTSWPTRDGTGVRDYVHVRDVARAHVAALTRLDRLPTFQPIDVGTGEGTTVRELVRAFEAVTGEALPHRDGSGRPGDVAGSVCRGGLAMWMLGWAPQLGVADGIRDALRSAVVV